MTTVFDVDSIGSLISLVAWGMVVSGVQWAVFASFWAGELQAWVKIWSAPVRNEMAMLRWQRQYGVRWEPRLDRVKPADLAATGTRLTPDELAADRVRYGQLKRRSLHWRVLQYGLGCTGCQTFFSTLVVFAVVGWPGLAPAVLTAILYAGVAARGLPLPAAAKSGGCGGKR